MQTLVSIEELSSCVYFFANNFQILRAKILKLGVIRNSISQRIGKKEVKNREKEIRNSKGPRVTNRNFDESEDKPEPLAAIEEKI